MRIPFDSRPALGELRRSLDRLQRDPPGRIVWILLRRQRCWYQAEELGWSRLLSKYTQKKWSLRRQKTKNNEKDTRNWLWFLLHQVLGCRDLKTYQPWSFQRHVRRLLRTVRHQSKFHPCRTRSPVGVAFLPSHFFQRPPDLAINIFSLFTCQLRMSFCNCIVSRLRS